MTVKISTILLNVATTLQDEQSHIRWPLPELMRYASDGLLEIIKHRLDANTEQVILPLVAGTAQTVSAADAYAVIDVISNTNADASVRGRSVRRTRRVELDASMPDWHSATPTPVAKNFILDPVNKTRFWVYPPNDGTGHLDVTVTMRPPTLTIVGDVNDLTSYDVAMPLDDVYAPALGYYILHRAWRKDADFANKPDIAQNYYNLFAATLGVKPDDADTGTLARSTFTHS